MIPDFKTLVAHDPPALSSSTGDYLERPSGGWVQSGNDFAGIGYHGLTAAHFCEKWVPAKAGLGHIPTKGYG